MHCLAASLIMRQSLSIRGSKQTWNRLLIQSKLHRIHSSNPEQNSPYIEPPNVQKLAQLAQIRITDEEAADWEPKIASIVDWFGQLQQVNLEGVEPSLRANIEDGNAYLRKDIPHDFAGREAMLQQAPERDGPFIKVPKTITES